MPYYIIDDWSGGVDLRRMPVVASPTTLLQLENAHINPGGEIEKRKAFVDFADATTQTFGLAVVQDQLTVFGTAAVSPLPGGSPLDYMQLDSGASPIVHVEDWDLFDGLLYVVGRAADGNYFHFYDGTLVPGGLGRHIRTYGEKIYSVLDKNMSFCATGDPTDWIGTGSGTINLSTQDAESLDLEGIEIYYDQLAVFSRRATQMWRVDPDPLANQQIQVLRSAGTIAGHSARQYGGGDLLYLDSSGVRSLRARDSSNAASVSDIGSPIDSLMQQRLLEDETAFTEAISRVEQGTGRFWLALGDEIHVLSHFPGPKVTAWSKYIPEVPVDTMVAYKLGIATRGTDDRIYLYGGENYNQYDAAKISAITPYLATDKPATHKEFEALDIAGENLWTIDVCYDSNLDLLDENSWLFAGKYDGVTYNKERMALSGYGSHIAYRMTCDQDGYARLANLATHYQEGDAG